MADERRIIRCAIYTRKSSEEGLEQEFNSLDAQFEACFAYVASQKHEGWKAQTARYDDGGCSGGTLERPALRRLFEDIDAGRVDMVVVYKIDRLTRSLLDFGKLVERLDKANCSFVSVTQSFNTSTSMGRLMLNVLLSFAQFEREVTAERIRDKIAASKKKGIWMGGVPPLGYTGKDRQLVINEPEATVVRQLFDLYREHRCIVRTKQAADRLGIRSRPTAKYPDGPILTRGGIYWLLTNPVYVGEIRHKSDVYPGLHAPLIDRETWTDVQTLLTSQPSGRARGSGNTALRSLFAGKIVDETGDRLVPSHSGKPNRRHRYYVSRRLIEGDDVECLEGGWRLPADHLERLVASLVSAHLSGPGSALRAVVAGEDAALVATANKNMQSFATEEGHSKIPALIDKVCVTQGTLKIDLARVGLADAIGIDPASISPSFLHIAAPFQMRRRGVETRLLLGDNPSMVDPALLKFVARAAVWWQSILDGKTIADVAKSAAVSERLVGIHLPAAFLAPDILELIVDGRQPSSLTVASLRNQKIPSLWEDQRKLFGLAKTTCKSAPDFAAT